MAQGTIPGGYTQQQAIKIVRSRTNEASLPVDTTVIGYLNDGLEQIVADLEILTAVDNVAVTAGNSTVELPPDIQDIQRLTWSTDLPTKPGVIEYPMTELGPGQFVDQTGQFPTTGGGPVILWRRLTDESQQITIQVYPLTAAGYINVYQHARPICWGTDPQADAQSTTNVDSAYQRLAITFACIAVCENRENLVKAQFYQQQLYGTDGGQTEGDLGRARQRLGRRRTQRGSQVRDVSAFPQVQPSWFPR